MIALEGADAIYQRCLDLAFNPTGDPIRRRARSIHQRSGQRRAPSGVDRTFTNAGTRGDFRASTCRSTGTGTCGGGSFNLNTSRVQSRSMRLRRTGRTLPEIERQGFNTVRPRASVQRLRLSIVHDGRLRPRAWNMSVRHQYWPELEQCLHEQRAANAVHQQQLPVLRPVLGVRQHRFRPVHAEHRHREPARQGAAVPEGLNGNPTWLPTAAIPFQFPRSARIGTGTSGET